MRHAAAFVRLARLKFLVGGFAGFALGAAIAAYGGARLSIAGYAAGQTLVTAFHLMTHFANDYFDRASDRLGRPTEFSGGSGVLVSGALGPAAALGAALTCAAVGIGAVAAFAFAAQPAVALVGAAIGFGAWAYSAPPLRLAARGWGEFDAALVVGVLVPLCGVTVFAGRIGPRAAVSVLAPALAMLAMMIAVEWPDREADAAGGKRHLIVRLGPRRAGRVAAGAALAVVPALFVTLAVGAPASVALVAVLLTPIVAGFVRSVLAGEPSPAELAGRGVCLFLLTVLFELLGYAAAAR